LLECRSISDEHKLKAQVNDIMWSPITSSCFALVADDGRIEIWDLKIDPLAPVKIKFDEERCPKTIVRFLVMG
jgi:WD40 repeat protein